MKEEQYNIKDLEKLTGIKAHTIRIWEKRYALLEPKRTNTNIRYYSADDLKKLLNISILNKNGIKISRIAELKDSEISQKVIEFTTRNNDTEDQIQALIMAMFHMNLPKFEKLLTVSYINRGFENTYSDIILPFLTKVGFLWQAGTINPAQEHFASNIIRRKIAVAIDGLLANYSNKSKKYILFLPEGEQHEISLLYAHYLLKKNNDYVTYLGASVPFQDIDQINTIHQSDYLVTSFTSEYDIKGIEKYIDNLSRHFSNVQIIVLRPLMGLDKTPLPDNVKIIDTIDKFIKIISAN